METLILHIRTKNDMAEICYSSCFNINISQPISNHFKPFQVGLIFSKLYHIEARSTLSNTFHNGTFKHIPLWCIQTNSTMVHSNTFTTLHSSKHNPLEYIQTHSTRVHSNTFHYVTFKHLPLRYIQTHSTTVHTNTYHYGKY